jgi:signal peptidase I
LIKLAKLVLFSLYALGAAALAAFALPQTGLKALTVATGSMQPALPPGSLAIIRRVPYGQINAGDIITFTSPVNPRQTITHRVVKTATVAGLPGFVTKGDANQTADRPILGGNVVGKVVYSLPFLGSASGWLRHPAGLAAFVVLPGLMIIINELKLLWRRLGEEFDVPAEPALVYPARMVPVAVRPARRPLDGLSRLPVVLLAVVALAVGTTRAQLTATATLSGNTIATLPRSEHLLINRVFIGTLGESICPSPLDGASISNTGPGSTNQISISRNCRLSITNSSNIVVNNQVSQTGSHNTSQVTTTIVIGADGTSLFDAQWIELHNPTAHSVALGGWQVVDDSGIHRSISAQTIPAGGFAVISKADLGNVIGNGLGAAADRVVLKSPAGVAVDAASWGSDNTQLNPPVPAIPSGGGMARIAPGYDTDTAADWTISF